MGDDSSGFPPTGQLMLDPIFRLTLHSRGRAHFELLAWFFQRFPDAGERTLYRWVSESSDASHFVTTEISGVDLVAKVPGRVPCMLSCDVLDAPTPERIERMTKSTPAGLHGDLLVLSLIDPRWDEQTYWTSQGHPARWIDYRTFLVALNGAAAAIDGNEFEAQLIERYCSSMKLAAIVLDSIHLHHSGEPLSIDESDIAMEGWLDTHQLRLLKLDRTAERLRVHQAAELIHSLSTHRQRTAIEVVSVRGKPTLQQSRELANGDWIGWQYRGAEWRQFVRTTQHAGTSAADRQRREIYVRANYAPWFDEPLELDVLAGHSWASDISAYTITDPDLVSRSRKVGAPSLSVDEIVPFADHLITFSYDWFGG